jgi:hypothetical protein
VASDEGISWFTLRNAWDSGARYMPVARAQLRAARQQNFAHREATAAPMPVLAVAELARTEDIGCATVLEQTADGMASWRYRLPGGASLRGPAPGEGGGQFWIVLSGSASAAGAADLPVNSCLFVGPEDGVLTALAGAGGAEVLCVQFPRLARH